MTPPHARLFSFPRTPPPFFVHRLLSSRGDEGDPSPPPLLAATRGYLEQMSPAWIKQRSLLATSKPSLRKPWDLDVVALPRTVASNGSRLLDQAATWTCGINTATRRARELAAMGEGIAREKESARATRERISREDERFPDKNSWVHYFEKCQTLGDELIFPLAKRLGNWQTPTNSKFQLHNC